MGTLREALARRWDWLWRRLDHGEEELDRLDDRRLRFWSEFRDGQRQAEEAVTRSEQSAPATTTHLSASDAPQPLRDHRENRGSR